MYITINNVIGKKTIDLSYLISSGKEGPCWSLDPAQRSVEIAVITMFSDNIQYVIAKPRTIMDPISDNKKLIPSRTYAGRELISVLEGMIDLTQFVVDDQVIKTNKLRGIMELILNLDELDNTDNLEDGRPSNVLLTYHVTDDKDFTSFKPDTPQYKKLKNGEFTSLTLRITDQNGNIITDGPMDLLSFLSYFKMEYRNKLNPERSLRTPHGIEGTRQKVIVTDNPSEIDQAQLLLVRFPNLGSGDVIVPGMTNLSFNIELSSTADPKRTPVSNVGRAIVKKLAVKFEGMRY